jgi:hypothetical protein
MRNKKKNVSFYKKHRPAAANKIKASAYVAAVDYVNPKSEQFVLSIYLSTG